MTVETPYRDFLAFWERARDLARDEQVALWHELYADRHPGVLGNYLHWFRDMGSLEDALPRYLEVAGDLERRFVALDLEAGARAVAELMDVQQRFRAIAFVGFFTANAWMDMHEGEPTVFFALESSPHNLWDPSMSIHEFAHVAHELGGAGGWVDGVPGLALMYEAVAIGTAKRLVPDAGPAKHFGVEDFDTWLGACRAGWPHAREELLACLDTQDDRARRRFFWPDWGRDDLDVPERVGYFAAGEVVAALQRRHELSEIVRWSQERALAEVRGALESVPG